MIEIINPQFCPNCGGKAISVLKISDKTFFKMQCMNKYCKVDIFTLRVEYLKGNIKHASELII